MRDTADKDQHRQQGGGWNASHRQANTAQYRLYQRRHHHAQSHRTDCLTTQHDGSIASFGAQTRCEVANAQGNLLTTGIEQYAKQKHQRAM
ncbi:hypothetical protein D3C76_1582280 [compost metagenome]